jgi:hypothetical protein
MGRIINIYQKNQISNIKYCLRTWLGNARKLRIEHLEHTNKTLNNKKFDSDKADITRTPKAQKFESEQLSSYDSEMIPEI